MAKKRRTRVQAVKRAQPEDRSAPLHLPSQPPKPTHRLLRGYAFDPSLATQLETALVSEIMTREDLVAFIPLDEATAKAQGKKGWDMPAGPLFTALKDKTKGRVVISDVTKALPQAAATAGVLATTTYVDYFLK